MSKLPGDDDYDWSDKHTVPDNRSKTSGIIVAVACGISFLLASGTAAGFAAYDHREEIKEWVLTDFAYGARRVANIMLPLL